MVNVRGVNVYPAAVESVLRAVDAIVEYRCTVRAAGSQRAIDVEVEVRAGADAAATAALAGRRLRDALGPDDTRPAGSPRARSRDSR